MSKFGSLLICSLFASNLSVAQPWGVGRAIKKLGGKVEQEIINFGDSVAHVAEQLKPKPADEEKQDDGFTILFGRNAANIYPFTIEKWAYIVNHPTQFPDITTTAPDGTPVVSKEVLGTIIPHSEEYEQCRGFSDFYWECLNQGQTGQAKAAKAQFYEFDCQRFLDL